MCLFRQTAHLEGLAGLALLLPVPLRLRPSCVADSCSWSRKLCPRRTTGRPFRRGGVARGSTGGRSWDPKHLRKENHSSVLVPFVAMPGAPACSFLFLVRPGAPARSVRSLRVEVKWSVDAFGIMMGQDIHGEVSVGQPSLGIRVVTRVPDLFRNAAQSPSQTPSGPKWVKGRTGRMCSELFIVKQDRPGGFQKVGLISPCSDHRACAWTGSHHP